MNVQTNPPAPALSPLSFLTVAAGVAMVVLAYAVVARFDPWLMNSVALLGLAVVAAGVAALTDRLWARRTKWALLALAVVGFAGRLLQVA